MEFKKNRLCNYTLDPNEMEFKKTRVQFYIRPKLDYKKTVCNFTLDPNEIKKKPRVQFYIRPKLD